MQALAAAATNLHEHQQLHLCMPAVHIPSGCEAEHNMMMTISTCNVAGILHIYLQVCKSTDPGNQ